MGTTCPAKGGHGGRIPEPIESGEQYAPLFYLLPIRAAGCAKRPGKKWRELYQCNRGREIRAERQADPIRGKQIKNLGSRIPERCGTDPGERITGSRSGGTTCKHFQDQGQRDPGRTGKRKGRGRA